MSKKSFEGAMTRLEEIVEALEQGDLSLEESLKVFEEGMELAGFCAGKLADAEGKLKKLVRRDDGYQLELMP